MMTGYRWGRGLLPTTLVLLLSACASVDFDGSLSRTSERVARLSDGELILKRSNEDIEHAEAIVERLIVEPLSQEDAVQVAMANSPAFQAVLAQNWAQMSDAAQSGRIPNPVFNFERVELGAEVEIGRLLSFGLLDIVTLPLRQRAARSRVEIAEIRLSNAVIEEVLAVRQAWVEAISAQQHLSYARQVFESAEASAELARRMEAVGNFSALDRARQQTFYSDAAAQLTVAQHNMTASREKLIRHLGLDDTQMAQLQLPERLPDLPDEPLSTDAVTEVASSERLDVKMAQASLNAASRAQGYGPIASYTDIEFGLRHDTVFDDGNRENADGYEFDITVPLFDWGGLKRDAMNARTLAAANHLEATVLQASSSLREAYSAYRASYDVARLYQDEILPVQELMAEESVLLYNGMLIGVFELLSESRRQITTVQGAISAAEQYWMSEAALHASIIGKPTQGTLVSVAEGAGDGGGEDH